MDINGAGHASVLNSQTLKCGSSRDYTLHLSSVKSLSRWNSGALNLSLRAGGALHAVGVVGEVAVLLELQGAT